MKISVGILCYNEEDFIGPCLDGVLKFAHEVFVSDGTMNGTNVDPGQRSETVEPSSDRSREIIAAYAEHDKRIEIVNLDGLPTPTEAEIRNVHYEASSGDYFMIVDADEIWTQDKWKLVEEEIDKHPDVLDFCIPNRLFFVSPHIYIKTKNWRVFKKMSERRFYGNNEMLPLDGSKHIVTDDNIWFYHYGYIDEGKVKRKMDLYSSDRHYGRCGPWWFENIFQRVGVDSMKKLLEKNNGTLHPWGKILPGFAAEEWGTIHVHHDPHPATMRSFFMGKENKGLSYV